MNRISRFWNWKYLFILLLVIHLVPIWAFLYFPTQDGPSHIYNSKVLKEYHNRENYQIRQVFKINLKIFPNWLSHLSMMILMYIVPPMIAEKILLSACIALVPLSLWYLLDAIDRRNVIFSLFGFIYAYHNLLHMGFYNFALSVPMFLFALGYWWKHRQDIKVHQIVILNVLLFLTYLSHFASYALLLVAMATIAVVFFLSKTAESLGEMKNTKLSVSAISREIFQQVKPLGKFSGYMLLAYAIGLEYYLASRDPTGGSFTGIAWAKKFFWDMLVFVSYTDWHIGVMRFLLGLLFAATFATLVYRIWFRKPKYKSSLQTIPEDCPVPVRICLFIYLRIEQSLRGWRFIERDIFLLLCIIFTVMFFKSPRGQCGGGWVSDRIYIYAPLFLVAWFVTFHKPLRYIFGAGLIILSLTNLGRHCYEYALLQPEIAEQASATKLVEPHSTFSIRIASATYSESLGELKYVGPFLHSPCYYGLAKDIAYLDDYEAGCSYFPVNWASSYQRGDADYILAWGYPEDTKDFDGYKDKYDLIYFTKSTKRLRLFRLKQSEPNLDDWDKTDDGRLILRLDMQPSGVETAEGYHAIGKDTRHVSGKYGWVTGVPGNDRQGAADISEPYRDYVWDTSDAAFRIDLPNGTYRVTCYFSSGHDGSHEINLIANEKKIIKHLVLPPGNTTTERSYTVNVTNEQLTQVIYTTWRRTSDTAKQNYWALSGILVASESFANKIQ